MLTINERRMGEAIILGLAGMLVVPDDDALWEAVSGCASNGGRLVVLDIGGLVRVDAGGLGALVRSRNLLVSRDGELRLINSTGVVDELLRLTRLDSIIPTLRAEPDSQERSDGGAVRASAAAPANAPWWGASWSNRTA
jgi:anti-anti-sigma factor